MNHDRASSLLRSLFKNQRFKIKKTLIWFFALKLSPNLYPIIGIKIIHKFFQLPQKQIQSLFSAKCALVTEKKETEETEKKN